jgi:acyl carrier protein
MPDLATEILAEIRRILAAELEVARPVELDHKLAGDLEVDSMGAIVLAVGLEDRFRVKLSEADAGAVFTVRDLVEVVERRVNEAATRKGSPPPGPDEAVP